jgi:hypothetical protein
MGSLTCFMANFAIASFLISGLIGSMTLLSDAPTSRSQADGRPEWRTDLRPDVRSSPVRPIVTRQESVGRPWSSLWFVNNNTIVATFVVHEEGGKAQVSRRDNLDSTLPLRLRAMFLDASTGKITASRDWPTDSRMARIVAVHGGKLVTLGKNELTLYSPDLTPIKSISLPVGSFGWIAHTSPSGKSLLFSSADFREGPWIWVETDSLTILNSWEDSPSGLLTISDKNVGTSTCWWGGECKSWKVNGNGGAACVESGPKCESKIQIRELSTGWKTIGDGEKYQHPQFVNDEMIFLPGKDNGKLIGIDGKVILDEPRLYRSWGCGDTGVVPAANGHRFLIPNCLWKGAVASLDIGSHPVLKQVFVYDIGSHVQSKSLDVKGPKIQNDMQFAISPDGTKLVILNDEFVEMFKLPPEP